MKFYCFSLIALLFFSCSSEQLIEKTEKESLPSINNVFPSTDTLPENLLRFYIQFSQPMKTVNNLENIKLLDENGYEIKGAIFNNVYELWNQEQTQLTLILDPARVKTGLIAHDNLGRALQPNKRYQLVIEKAEDINNNSIEKVFIKNFFVTNADITIPDTNNWNIIVPPANSKSSLRIVFPQPLDRLSLFSRIGLLDEQNKLVKGKVIITHQEKEWQLIPNQPWKKGIYYLQVNSRLEDPAGNNLNGLFDHKIGTLKDKEEGKIIKIKIELN